MVKFVTKKLLHVKIHQSVIHPVRMVKDATCRPESVNPSHQTALHPVRRASFATKTQGPVNSRQRSHQTRAPPCLTPVPPLVPGARCATPTSRCATGRGGQLPGVRQATAGSSVAKVRSVCAVTVCPKAASVSRMRSATSTRCACPRGNRLHLRHARSSADQARLGGLDTCFLCFFLVPLFYYLFALFKSVIFSLF